MKLRPRYSLLTLLVLTALVAGGVKWWWYGPHHVVEPGQGSVEVEYSYTRDAWGNRVIEGPLIARTFQAQRLAKVCVYYYRQGKLANWSHETNILPRPPGSSEWYVFEECPLPQADRKILEAAFQAEMQRLAAQGFHHGNTYERSLPGGFDFDPNR